MNLISPRSSRRSFSLDLTSFVARLPTGNSQPASLPRQNYRHHPDSRNSGGSQPILGDGNYATPASGERRSVGHMSGRRAMRTTPRTGQYALFNPRRASSAMASPFPNVRRLVLLVRDLKDLIALIRLPRHTLRRKASREAPNPKISGVRQSMRLICNDVSLHS